MKRTEEEKRVLAMSKDLRPIDVFDYFENDIYELESELLDYYSYNSSYYYAGQKCSIFREATDTWKTFCVRDYVNGNFVDRYFNVNCHKRSLNSLPIFTQKEVCQDWYKEIFGNRIALRMLSTNDLEDYYIFWNNRTKLIPRKVYAVPDQNNNVVFAKSDAYLEKALPTYSRAIQEVYSITNNIHYVRAMDEDSSIREHIAEYFAKNGMLDWLEYYMNISYRINEYFDSIKIAHRHKYQVQNLSKYLEYLNTLERIGRDIKNPHYICPTNFEQEYEAVSQILDRYNRREAERRRREADERRRREAAEALRNAEQANEKYIKEHKKYLAIEFMSSDKSIKFHVLQSVPEFLEEGTKMKHCVYSMGYFKRKDSIILSARNAKTNERLATVEISLTDYKILQCYAYGDKISKQDKKIRKAVEDNMKLFKKAS